VARVVVIGSGVGGMAAAARLRVKGHDVEVLEQAPTYGGKLGTYARDGFVFDTGPSLLTLPAVYRDLFLKTGGALEEAVDLQPLEPAFGYRWADGSTVTMPGVSPALCADALQEGLGGSASVAWRGFMEHAAKVWQLTRRDFLEAPLEGPRQLVSMARSVDSVRTVAPFTSLRRLGRKHFDDPRLVTLLDRYATYTGSDPRRAPSALCTVPYVEQTFGAWHLGGGIRTLADALHLRAQERGVRFSFGADVVGIDAGSDGVTGVLLRDGSRVPADVVIANADASHVYGDLLGDVRAARARRRLRAATPSLSGFVMLLAVEGRTPGLRHHNVWFPRRYDDEFDAVFGRTARPVPDPTVYVCAPDDPAMRPDDDTESWFVLVNAPRHGSGTPGSGTVDWDGPGVAEGYADHVLGVMARRGFDVRGRLRWREVRTPADLQRATRAPGGAIYGTSSNGARAAFLRPANATAVPGLYLVGGSSHPGGGLPLVGLSAEIVANLVGRAS
jgi:phytoene desaturase